MDRVDSEHGSEEIGARGDDRVKEREAVVDEGGDDLGEILVLHSWFCLAQRGRRGADSGRDERRAFVETEMCSGKPELVKCRLGCSCKDGRLECHYG